MTAGYFRAQFGAVAVMVLYLLISNTITYQWYAHVAFMLAFTYGLNNVLIILSGVASPSTQLHLPETLFVSARARFARPTIRARNPDTGWTEKSKE
ncbi:hypothetical protein HPB48_006903 [Haemaphysalis longicornis]|uniref:Uncharacterized protein n=1 Tax=Haemaphysalis longicornis TaxID=44386 RepID=A0A9J6FEH5_HAELO|nr:hypothetical protein HPB48_006903 [Haemaphysalis longicornis]